MRAFVDTSAWFAAASAKDRHHDRAIELLRSALEFKTSSFVLVETWLLLQSKMGFVAAEAFSDHIRLGAAAVATMEDIARAWYLPKSFTDQSFSLVDRTSFAMMERLGISTVVAFDDDFVIYRFGLDRRQAFEVLR
jgi:predicted nucleic acid-binding protein